MSAGQEEWLCGQLGELLGVQVEDVRSMARHLLGLGKRSMPAALAYAEDLLGQHPSTQQLLQALAARMQNKGKGTALTVKYDTHSKHKKRSPCGCFGGEHSGALLCTVCGRILCGLEGEGECFFCKSKVYRSGTLQNTEFVQARRAMDSARVGNHHQLEEDNQLEDVMAVGLQRAIAQKNKLMQFAKDDTVKRIIDDQEDFYDLDDVEANVWLDDEEREMYEEKALENEERLENVTKTYRAPVKVTLDFENKEVIQEEDLHRVEAKLKDVKIDSFLVPKMDKRDEGKIMRGCTTLDAQAKQVYEQLRAAAAEKLKAKLVQAPKKKNRIKIISNTKRIQDDENDF
jgi:hypothetical protein